MGDFGEMDGMAPDAKITFFDIGKKMDRYYVSFFLSVFLSALLFLSVDPCISSIYLFIYLLIYVSISMYLSIYLCIYLSTYVFFHPFLFLLFLSFFFFFFFFLCVFYTDLSLLPPSSALHQYQIESVVNFFCQLASYDSWSCTFELKLSHLLIFIPILILSVGNKTSSDSILSHKRYILPLYTTQHYTILHYTTLPSDPPSLHHIILYHSTPSLTTPHHITYQA